MQTCFPSICNFLKDRVQAAGIPSTTDDHFWSIDYRRSLLAIVYLQCRHMQCRQPRPKVWGESRHERSRALRRKSFYSSRFPVKRVKIVTDSIHIYHGFREKTVGRECYSYGYVATSTRKIKLSLFFVRAFHSNRRKPASPKKTSTCLAVISLNRSSSRMPSCPLLPIFFTVGK